MLRPPPRAAPGPRPPTPLAPVSGFASSGHFIPVDSCVWPLASGFFRLARGFPDPPGTFSFFLMAGSYFTVWTDHVLCILEADFGPMGGFSPFGCGHSASAT